MSLKSSDSKKVPRPCGAKFNLDLPVVVPSTSEAISSPSKNLGMLSTIEKNTWAPKAAAWWISQVMWPHAPSRIARGAASKCHLGERDEDVNIRQQTYLNHIDFVALRLWFPSMFIYDFIGDYHFSPVMDSQAVHMLTAWYVPLKGGQVSPSCCLSTGGFRLRSPPTHRGSTRTRGIGVCPRQSGAVGGRVHPGHGILMPQKGCLVAAGPNFNNHRYGLDLRGNLSRRYLNMTWNGQSFWDLLSLRFEKASRTQFLDDWTTPSLHHH